MGIWSVSPHLLKTVMDKPLSSIRKCNKMIN